MRHSIIIEQGAENFSAYAPDFPRCVAAADTEQETIALMTEALELHIEDLSKQVATLLPNLHSVAEATADGNNISATC